MLYIQLFLRLRNLYQLLKFWFGVRALFEGILVNSLVLVIALIALDRASYLAIENTVKIADATGMGKTTIGFVLISFSTSLPELLVAIFAALGVGKIGIAIGNVLGSNICNVAFILGVCIIIASFRKDCRLDFTPCITKEELGGTREVETLYFGLFAASLIPLFLTYIGYASKSVGIILLALFFIYMYQLSKARNIKEEVIPEILVENNVETEIKREDREGARGKTNTRILLSFIWVLVGIGGVIGSSYFIVESASYIASALGVPSLIIGATIVALGTSLPELATSLQATRKGHLELAFGNIIGSGFINLTCILGATLVASPFQVNMTAYSNTAIFSVIVNMFLWYFLSSEKLGLKEGILLLILYIMFLLANYGIINLSA